ncbi:MAG: UDP-3-O-[3-hydroxymyristoyl] N-acetylglucosamine deacetylase [Candidatus Omnitrophica bacterium]|nr:UDP-3-O-[3-hydroxymyristoyl] N-acetylglucosamine deacetylase [Candidatus Omnitrophota bacterium]
MVQQKTIKKETKASGTGIHTGQKAQLCFKPAAKDSGINFVRVDLAQRPVVRACIGNVIEESLTLRRTSLGKGSVEIHTVEHLLSALFALGIDNIIVEIDAQEVPALGGSAADFYKILNQAGIVALDGAKKEFIVKEPLGLKEDDTFLLAFPSENFRISYTLSYPELPLNQYFNLVVNEANFLKELAPCKTFCLEMEAEQLRRHGLGQGATEENTILLGKKGVIKGKPTFPDEFARHKVLDLIGDFCLLAPVIKAHIVAVKSGHPTNIRLLQMLEKAKQSLFSSAKEKQPLEYQSIEPPFDIEKIMRILPHRYPFLLVDRILEFEEGRHITGVKNVTINEHFFTGHFPGRPVMPGVLILEAMAQTAGILMLSRAESRGKLAYFMSMDRVKFRKTVLPGDQLILKVDVIRIKSRTIQIRTKALVDEKIVAEAEMMFSLVEK